MSNLIRRKLKLGDWASKSNSTIYQAAADGFVVAADDTDAAAYDVEIYVEDVTPPTVKRSIAGASSFARGGSVECLVRKGEYWKTENAVSFVYWRPLE